MVAHPTPGDGPALYRLPNELLVEVLLRCPDLSSLWSLATTSRLLAAVFDARAAEITESVLDATVPVQTRALMQAVVRLRTKAPGPPTYRAAEETMRHPIRPLDRDMPPSMVRKFLGLAHKIHMLAHGCMDWCLHMCWSRQKVVGASSALAASATREQRQAQKGFGAPSWIEEQRAVLAVWRVQFFLELKVAGRKERLGWPAEDLRRLQFVTIRSFYAGGFVHHVLTVLDFLGALGTSLEAHVAGTFQGPVSLPGSTPLRLPEEVDGSWTCQRCPGSINEMTIQQPEASPLPRWITMNHRGFPLPAEGYTAGEEWKNLDRETIGWVFLFSTIGNPEAGPLQELHFEPFRKFGISFWEETRMVSLGLWSQAALSDAAEYYTRWYGLLTKEEIADNTVSEEDW